MTEPAGTSVDKYDDLWIPEEMIHVVATMAEERDVGENVEGRMKIS